MGDAEPRKARKTLRRIFRPFGAEFNTNTKPGLAFAPLMSCARGYVLKPLRGSLSPNCS